MTYRAQISSSLGPMLLQSDGSNLTGLYFIGQKDCLDGPGASAIEPGSFDPSAGAMAGIPIRKFKAVKSSEANRDLFEDEARVGSGAGDTKSGAHTGLNFVGNELQLMQDHTPESVLIVFRQIRAELSEYFFGKRRVFNTPLAFNGTDFQKKVWQALLTIPYGEFVSYGDVAHAAGLTAQHGRAVGAAVGRNPISIVVPCHRVLSSAGTLTGYSGGLERKFALLELEGFLLRQPRPLTAG